MGIRTIDFQRLPGPKGFTPFSNWFSFDGQRRYWRVYPRDQDDWGAKHIQSSADLQQRYVIAAKTTVAKSDSFLMVLLEGVHRLFPLRKNADRVSAPSFFHDYE